MPANQRGAYRLFSKKIFKNRFFLIKLQKKNSSEHERMCR